MTLPWPSVNWNAWPRSHDASNCFFVEKATPTYWTLTESPHVAARPVPTTRSCTTSEVGGVASVMLTTGFFVMSSCKPAGGASAVGVGHGADGPAVPPVVAAVVPDDAGWFELLPQAAATVVRAAKRSTVAVVVRGISSSVRGYQGQRRSRRRARRQAARRPGPSRDRHAPRHRPARARLVCPGHRRAQLGRGPECRAARAG